MNAGTIPVVRLGGALVRLVAGELGGQRGPVTEIAANPIYMEVQLEPGAVFEQATPYGHTTIAYVFEGKGMFDSNTQVEAVHMVVFGDGDAVQVQALSDSPLRFMLVSGAPFKEPIVPYGPFVMNTTEEIQQALEDLRNGTFVR